MSQNLMCTYVWGMVKASVHSQGCPLQTTDTKAYSRVRNCRVAEGKGQKRMPPTSFKFSLKT